MPNEHFADPLTHFQVLVVKKSPGENISVEDHGNWRPKELAKRALIYHSARREHDRCDHDRNDFLRLLYISSGLSVVGEFAKDDRVTLLYTAKDDKTVDIGHLISIVLARSRIPHDFKVELKISDGYHEGEIKAVRIKDNLYFFLSSLDNRVNLRHVKSLAFVIINDTCKDVSFRGCSTLFESIYSTSCEEKREKDCKDKDDE